MSDHSQSSGSSDSESDDEEYLLSSTDENREAMIRRKLLESFYGSSEPDGSQGRSNEQGQGQLPNDTNTNTNTNAADNSKNKKKPSDAAISNANANLDSTNFNPSLYTSNLIHNSNTTQILHETNNLSLSIRQLDSTMQTLVYENYSKFISATDAIRSIGQSVDLSNEGLDRLHSKMQVVEENTRRLETSLSDKRKQVVEKLKLKRLLTRLTRLVELPVTLRGMQERGEYRFGMRDYLDAMKILTRHTDNFESLKNIEGECGFIVKNMMEEVGLKMWVWCGGDMNGHGNGGAGAGSINRNRSRRRTKAGKSGVLDRFWMSGGRLGAREGKVMDVMPASSVAEMYECAGAMLMYANACNEQENEDSEDGTGEQEQDLYRVETILGKLTADECKAMALESITVYLEGILEDHAIDVQVANNDHDNARFELSLYPSKFLDSLLEAATLYGITFRSQMIKGDIIVDQTDIPGVDAILLKEYVTMWFGTFLAHVKNVLLENALEVNNDSDESKEEDDDEIFISISNELMKLVQAVREVASGLALPEVGLDMDVASSLVEEAVGTTESMVKRRVMQKFKLLRVRVLKECITPFVKNVIEDEASSGAGDNYIVKCVQSANITLSDSMQFVDDTIRSILCGGANGSMSTASLDSEMVKLSVFKNAREFAFWLAAALESIAGCESTRNNTTMDVRPITKPDDEAKLQEFEIVLRAVAADAEWEPDGKQRKDSLDQQLIEELSGLIYETATDIKIDALTIALVEMSHIAKRNVSNNINQSIASCVEDPKSKHEFFRGAKHEQDDIDCDNLISTRFRLASSRALAIYSRNNAHEAASTACHEIAETCSVQSEFFPHGPSDAAIKMLEVTKRVCLDCAAAFGSDTKASAAPDFDVDYRQDMSMTGSLGHSKSGGNAIKSLSLDVARMFTQKVQVYSHPLDTASLSRDFVVAAVMRVACKAWVEQIRQSSFTEFAYRQIQVDVEFLKYLLPHYISEDSTEIESLQTVLNDIVLNAGERCIEMEVVGVTEYYDEAMGKVMSPLSIALGWLKEEDAAGGRGALDQFVIRKVIVEESKDELNEAE
jgi:hypothetical protein